MTLIQKIGISCAITLGVACGGDDKGASPEKNLDASTPTGQVGSGDGGVQTTTPDGSVTPVQGMDASTPSASSAYLLSTIILGTDSTSDSTYVSVVDSLDVKTVDTKSALEFGGQANVAVYNGKVYISDGAAPTITRYSLSADKQLVKETGVSFQQFGVPSVAVDSSQNTFVSPTKAYLSGGDGSTVIWNPTDMSIVGTIPAPTELVSPDPDNLTLQGSSGFARGNRLYRTFFWIDWSTYASPAQQLFVVYDTDNDTILSATSETRCPALGAVVTADENGTAYFSNWFYNVAGTLQSGAPASCALRLPTGTDALDPNWKLTFNALNGGHEGAQLSYTSSGKALFATFHQEAFSDLANTMASDLIGSTNWEVWSLDLASQQAQAVSGIDRINAQQMVFPLDGRTFVFASNADYSTTTVYEVKADGTGAKAFDFTGFSRSFLKIQ